MNTLRVHRGLAHLDITGRRIHEIAELTSSQTAELNTLRILLDVYSRQDSLYKLSKKF